MECKITGYVRYIGPGLIVENFSEQELATRDLTKVVVPDWAYAFEFFDIVTGSVRADSQEVELESDEINKSNRFYVGGTVYTLAEVKSEFPEERTLIFNMEGNGYERVIKTHRGNFIPVSRTDVFLAPVLAPEPVSAIALALS